MFKRVLVLVLFLFGVFWWLTSRDNEPQENAPEVVTIETETVADENSEEEREEAEVEETEVTPTPDNEEATPREPMTPVETETETEVTTTTTVPVVTPTPVVTVPVTPPVTEPVVVTPVVTPSRPTPVAPTIPDRTTDVKVYLYEWGLDLSDKTIPAGTINFQVQNDGRFTHDFNVSGFGNLGKLTPSQKSTFTIKLPAGDYEAFSERRQDYERGVNETFTVVD